MKEQMSSKERVLTALKHMETDMVPFGRVVVSLPAIKKLAEYLDMNMQEAMDYLRGFSDLAYIGPDYIGPKDRNMIKPDGTTVCIWGVERKPVIYGEGAYDEISGYPLANVQDVKELDDYEWPSANWWDVAGIKDKIRHINKKKESAIVMPNGNIFETAWYMRGLEQMFVDLITDPELAWEIMTRVTDYFIAYFTKALDAADGMIDIIFTADDIGQQQGLLMSLDLWEKMIKPHHIRLNKALHEYGVKIMYHSDGAIMEAVPGLIDMGIDILQAIQFDARGMDPVKLKEDYGDRLCFNGGISVQSTLPFGTTDDVRNEVKERIRVLGKNGGYILSPSHVIQAGTPPENIMAFLEAGGSPR